MIHRSTTDPDAQLFRKGGAGAVLSCLGHVVLDNRHGLVVNTCVTGATGTAEWDAVEMLLADVRCGTPGTPSVNASANSSSKSSAG